MPFALLNYNAAAAAAGASNVDLLAATDPDFTTQNSHYVFTEPYKLLGIMPLETSFTKGRLQMPTLNAIAEFDILQGNRSLSVPSNPQMEWYGEMGPVLSLNEQLQVQISNNLGAATEISNCGIILGTQGGTPWNQNLPKGQLVFSTQATFTVTPTLNAWSGGQALTFGQSLRGGTYSVIGCELQGANAAFFRMIFPRYQLYNGRKLRPGWWCQSAIGNQLPQYVSPFMFPLGEWGRFFTFEPPLIEVFGTNAAGTTYTATLRLVYLGTDPNLLGYGATSM